MDQPTQPTNKPYNWDAMKLRYETMEEVEREEDSWKGRKDLILAPKDYMESAHKLLRANNYLPPMEAECRTIFVADNNGSHSFAFFKVDKEYREGHGFSNVYAGDLANLTKKKPDFHDKDGSYTYRQFNALNLSAMDIPEADLIFDFKGAIWHASEIDAVEEKVELTTSLFKAYSSKLKRGGCIVLDSTNNNGEEFSTLHNLEQLGFLKDGQINEELFPEISKMFEVKEQISDGKESFFILQKI
jgi:hypothetical protein